MSCRSVYYPFLSDPTHVIWLRSIDIVGQTDRSTRDSLEEINSAGVGHEGYDEGLDQNKEQYCLSVINRFLDVLYERTFINTPTIDPTLHRPRPSPITSSRRNNYCCCCWNTFHASFNAPNTPFAIILCSTVVFPAFSCPPSISLSRLLNVRHSPYPDVPSQSPSHMPP